MSIYTPFKPTYLYIKQHSITGKLYFGKTIKDPEKYLGSGKHWLRHIKKHGKEHVVNLWYCLFLDGESIKEFALNFSIQENIVDSEQWLNLVNENGLDGGGNSCVKLGNHRKPRKPETTPRKRNPNHNLKISENNGQRVRCSCIKCKQETSSANLYKHVCNFLIEKNCLKCGKQFTSRSNFCSRSCITAFNNKLRRKKNVYS